MNRIYYLSPQCYLSNLYLEVDLLCDGVEMDLTSMANAWKCIVSFRNDYLYRMAHKFSFISRIWWEFRFFLFLWSQFSWFMLNDLQIHQKIMSVEQHTSSYIEKHHNVSVTFVFEKRLTKLVGGLRQNCSDFRFSSLSNTSRKATGNHIITSPQVKS